MEQFYAFIDNISAFIWGGPMILVLLGTGFFFMVILKGRPFRRLLPAFGALWRGRGTEGREGGGEISPWNALSTALSGQVGTGNLAGVATAITLGGPGAIFWMWITALVGMASAFAESSLAVKYREEHADGHTHGGPMFYIKNGLGKKWIWLAVLFSVGTIFSALATGNMIQANSIAEGLSAATGAPNWIFGLIVAALAFAVIIGGIKSIGSVAGKVVPAMALGYIVLAIIVLVMNADRIPDAFAMIFSYAFGVQQVVGGIAGYAVLEVVRFGVERGLFSNEAGQGSTAIAHAAAKTDDPVRQGEIAMLGTFLDTIVICTMTALVILVVQGEFASAGGTVQYAWQSTELQGIEVTAAAYSAGIPYGGILIAAVLAVFAFTTILGWSYYAEQAVTFLIGDAAAKPFRYVWVVFVFIGSLQQVDFIWKLGGIANAFMATPNLIAILALSGVVVAMVNAADGKK